MAAYYNEIDRYAAQFLRNLIAAGHIAPGEVDERDIRDVSPQDLKNFTQCHFFAGIGVWSYALRRAGWPDNRPVWTGSCPCQPFSSAGKGAGFIDERHLFPDWYHLIGERRPPTVFGEQVANKDGLNWFDLVQADMEGAGYAVGAADLCAAGVGAPHIRQRLWFVADRLADPLRSGREGGLRRGAGAQREIVHGHIGRYGSACGVADMYGDRRSERRKSVRTPRCDGSGGNRVPTSGAETPAGAVNGFWHDADWIGCRDGKFRPVEPGTFPLANGAANRVGRLRAYGNAIVAETAQTFISAYMDVADDIFQEDAA